MRNVAQPSRPLPENSSEQGAYIKAPAGKMPALLLLFILPFFLSNCSAKYSVRSVPAPQKLQWPYEPAKAKVTYLEAIHGFTRSASSKSLLGAIAGTKKKEDGGFILPVGIATGQDGRIAVADMSQPAIHLYVPSRKEYFRIVGQGGDRLTSPIGVAFDENLRLFVTDSSGKILAFAPDGSFLFSIRNAGKDNLMRPTGLAYNRSKKLLYVVDTLQHKVFAFRENGDLAFAFGGRGEKNGEFNFPTHMFVSSAGNLYITDSLNFRIQIFDPGGTFLSTFGHHGDGSGDFAIPKGVAVDSDGVIYVVDSLFDNLQLFNDKGNFLLTVGKRGTHFGEFWLPSGIFIDANNKMYVCDTYNRRIQVFHITERFS